jgi:nucleotide-binding universal stress UspA family protein
VAADPELQRRLEADARKRLDEALIDSDGRGPRALPAVVTAGSVPSAIIDYAKDRDIDIIVMGTHGRSGVAHMLMGSVAERVVRLARCPVLTVRHPEHDFVRPDTLVALAGVGTTPQKARN